MVIDQTQQDPAASDEAASSIEATDTPDAAAETAQVTSDTQQELDTLSEELSFSDSIRNFFDSIKEKIVEILQSIGLMSATDDSSTATTPTQGLESALSAAAIQRLSFDNLGERNTPVCYRLVKRQGNNILTAGMLGRLFSPNRNKPGGGDHQFDLDTALAEAQIRDLQARGITTIITLCGGGAHDAITRKLRELGINMTTFVMSLPSVRDIEVARAKWESSSRLVSSIKQSFQLYKQGKCCIHCHNGAHRSVCASLIFFMLDNPQLSYEEALALNLSSDEQTDSYFLAYAPLAQALDNNPDLRARLTAA